MNTKNLTKLIDRLELNWFNHLHLGLGSFKKAFKVYNAIKATPIGKRS